MKISLLVLPLLFVASSYASWHKYNHGVKNLISGMASMTSSTTKLFGVGRHGHLWERIFSSNSWHWVDHGVPPYLFTFEKLESTPCVLIDGKMFIITNHGRLFERHWANGNWHWVSHGRPRGDNNLFVSLDPTKCVATQGNNRHRVFAIGTDGQVYQRWWIDGAWRWRRHFRPNGAGISIVRGGIDAGITGTHLYAVASNGQLFRFGLSPNQQQNLWEPTLGRPSGFTNIRSLSVTTRNAVTRVIVVSVDNRIFQWGGNANVFWFGTRPNDVHSWGPPMVLSKEFQHTCGGTTTTMAMIKTPHTIYAMTIPNVGGFSYAAIGTNHHPFIDEIPAVLENPTCPKVFTVTNHGELVEFFV